MLNADLLVERSAIRKKLTFWRVAAIVALCLCVIVLGVTTSKKATIPTQTSAHIAKVKIEGVIHDDEKLLKTLDKIAASNAAAVIFEINSPGGTTAGAEQIYKSIRAIAEKKPTVALVKTLAASGGYIAALGTDRIVALETSLVGSIGVIMQYPNVEGLLKNIGVKMEEVKTSPLKAAPNGYEPTSPEARKALEDLVADSYLWFKTMVQTRRKLSDEELLKVADGRVFTGRQSVPLKLIDAIGQERDVVEWLKKEKKIDKNLKVREWSTKGKMGIFSKWIDEDTNVLFNLLGIDTKNLIAPKGLVSLWQPT